LTPLLVCENLACIRGGRLLFERLSFALAPGEALWLRGPNGIGKSSLLRLVAGLLLPDSGSITRPSLMALADERSALDPELPLAKALAFWGPLDGADPATVTEAITAMALAPLADVPVAMLSTGQRKRAVLARTIASGAQLWLLDEPGNGLDGQSLDLLRAAIERHRTGGGAIVFASHFDLCLPEQHELQLGAEG
jgi:heme exporter protein A